MDAVLPRRHPGCCGLAPAGAGTRTGWSPPSPRDARDSVVRAVRMRRPTGRGPRGLLVRGVFGSRRIGWEQVAGSRCRSAGGADSNPYPRNRPGRRNAHRLRPLRSRQPSRPRSGRTLPARPLKPGCPKPSSRSSQPTSRSHRIADHASPRPAAHEHRHRATPICQARRVFGPAGRPSPRRSAAGDQPTEVGLPGDPGDPEGDHQVDDDHDHQLPQCRSRSRRKPRPAVRRAARRSRRRRRPTVEPGSANSITHADPPSRLTR